MNSLAQELRGDYARPKGIPRKVNNLGMDKPTVGYMEERTALKHERERLCWGLIGKMSKAEIAEKVGCSLDMVTKYAKGYIRRMK